MDQLFAFTEAVVLGAALAICFDVYRAVRFQIRRHLLKLLLIAADCLYWIAAALACIIIIISRRWGEIYFYSYLGLAGGFSLYLVMLSRFLLPFWNAFFVRLFCFFSQLFTFGGKVYRVLCVPFCWTTRQTAKVAGQSRLQLNHLASRILSKTRRKYK